MIPRCQPTAARSFFLITFFRSRALTTGCTAEFGSHTISSPNSTGASIPRVTIKTGATTPDGHEEQLSEYICDWPHCPNVATRVLGVVRELATFAAVCDAHVPTTKS